MPINNQEIHHKTLKIIAKELDLDDFKLVQLQQKLTARGRKRYKIQSLQISYLVEIAETKVQKYYLNRTLVMQKEFKKLHLDSQIKSPILTHSDEIISYVVYKFIDGFVPSSILDPTNLLEKIELKTSKLVDRNDFDRVLHEFLRSWPESSQPVLASTLEFKLFKLFLYGRREILTTTEHGDFAKNNYIYNNESEYLIDFEFSRMLQPTGFDAIYYAFHEKQKFNKKSNFIINLIKIFLDYSFNEITDRGKLSKNIIGSIIRFMKFCFVYRGELINAFKF
jgi:hypothetical protein